MPEAVQKSRLSRKFVVGAFAAVALAVGGLWLIDPDALPIKGPSSAAEEPAAPAGAAAPLSEAERITRLQRSLDDNRKYLDRLKAQFKDPNNEFHRAKKRFQNADVALQQAKQAIKRLQDAGKAAEASARLAAQNDLMTRWKLNRARFNLAIKEHKALEEAIAALTRKIQQDQQALDHLSGADQPRAPTADSSLVTNPGGSTPAEATAPAKAAQTPAAPISPPSMPVAPSARSSSPSAPSQPGEAAAPAVNVPREVRRAREEARIKQEDANKAERIAQSITQRINALRDNITLTKKRLDTARQQADHEEQTKNTIDVELQKKAGKASKAELDLLADRIKRARRRLQEALAQVRSTTDHLNELQSELNTLQTEQISALHEAEAKKEDADAAEDKIAQMENPFRPRNMVRWLLHHGPRLGLIAIGMLVFARLARVLSRRLVRFMAQSSTAKRGSYKDRENRAQTLVGVLSSAVSLLVIGGGSLMILDEVGIPIVPLMGGAAVLGLAVAFGAQNLIKDYFCGFMVLLEDQYGINDVVSIGSISGLVEHISLRTTVLRDLEGVVHFVPHGTITTVSNLTHGWSRALFAIGVAYKEDVDRVMQVLLELGHELRKDPAFGPLILDNPEMLGVDGLADSSVVIKFFMKTQPLQQWTVRREMLRRIKNKFDALGIEIPFPHQTVYHRYATSPAGAEQIPYPPLADRRAG